MKSSTDLLKTDQYDPRVWMDRMKKGMRLESEEAKEGYLAEPNTTQTPNVFFDYFMAGLDDNELRVMLYLIRHTFGYKKKNGDWIAQSTFIDGIVKANGDHVDYGCGIKNRTSVIRALLRLEKAGLVTIMRGLKRNAADTQPTNFYKLVLKEEDWMFPYKRNGV